MRARAWLVVVTGALGTSAVAYAEPPIAAGVDAEILPAVHNESAAGALGTSADAGPTAAAVGGLVEWRATRVLSIGFAPRYLVGINAERGERTSDRQLDLRLRLAAGTDVSPALRLYGFAAPGYSTLFLSATDTMAPATIGSLAIGFGVGARYRVSPRLALTAEIGYQLVRGFKAIAIVGPGDVVTFKDDYLSIALGVVTPL